MASVYDRADIYDLLEDEGRYEAYKKHWEIVLQDKSVKTFLDVSIGSGNVTLPLAELGVRLYGSDLSETMLARCRQKAQKKNVDIEVKRCDFRSVSEQFSERFDCVASTGNSLPYVSNEDVLATLGQMDRLVKPGGYLATCSCSHFAEEEKFAAMLHSAARDAGVRLRQIEARQQSCDHPILWGVEETNYLKFFLFQVV